jgi:hypothetical protein
MKAINRKIGDPPPHALMLNADGSFSMVDGSNPMEYIQSFMEIWTAKGIVFPLEVSIIPRESVHQLETESILYRAMGA